MDYDWELRAGRVIRRLRIDRRKNSTKDLAKDGTVQRLHGLNRVRDEKMAATTQTVMVVVSRVWRRSLLRAFCCRESRRPLLPEVETGLLRRRRAPVRLQRPGKDKSGPSGGKPRPVLRKGHERTSYRVRIAARYQVNQPNLQSSNV